MEWRAASPSRASQMFGDAVRTLGTILLAIATALLALLTRREVKASLEEVAVSRQALHKLSCRLGS